MTTLPPGRRLVVDALLIEQQQLEQLSFVLRTTHIHSSFLSYFAVGADAVHIGG